MADTATSTPAPGAERASLYQLRVLWRFADAARDILPGEDKRWADRDAALHAICDQLVGHMIAAPVRRTPDLHSKLWLLELFGEREWDFDAYSRPVLNQVRGALLGVSL